MEYKDVLDTMTGEYNNLTKSGRKAADYIFAHRVEAQYMSITALAEECGVAEATISRFCRTLGFSGYNDFKLALAKASGARRRMTRSASMERSCRRTALPTCAKSCMPRTMAAIGQDAGADRRGERGPGSEISFRRTAGSTASDRGEAWSLPWRHGRVSLQPHPSSSASRTPTCRPWPRRSPRRTM